MLHPLMAGLPPELSWPSLEMFESKVLPHIEVRRREPTAFYLFGLMALSA